MAAKQTNRPSIWWNLVASGLPTTTGLEVLRKVVLFNMMTGIGTLCLLTLGTLAFAQGNAVLGVADFVACAIVIGLSIYLRRSHDVQRTGLIFCSLLALFFMFLFTYGGVNRSAFLWCYTYPLITLFALGKRWGIISSLSLIGSCVVSYVLQRQFMETYNLDLILRFVPSYLAITFFAYLSEDVRARVQDRLSKSNHDLVQVIASLERAREELSELAVRDALTGLHNRRHFNQTAPTALASARRYDGCTSLLMIDIDKFKLYNDTLGHPAGDRALQQVAQAISSVLRRETDTLCRYGGEEFVVLLEKTSSEGATEICKRIHEAVREAHIYHPGTENGTLTFSAGIACVPPDERTDVATLVQRADIALYEAKRCGRNCSQQWNDTLNAGPASSAQN